MLQINKKLCIIRIWVKSHDECKLFMRKNDFMDNIKKIYELKSFNQEEIFHKNETFWRSLLWLMEVGKWEDESVQSL